MKMAHYNMKANFQMTNIMAKENFIIQMEIIIQVNLKKEKSMDLVLIIIKMVRKNMKENLKKMNIKISKRHSILKMGKCIQVNFKKEKKMDKG